MSAIVSALPFLLLLACPLMMIFMMKGMGGGHDKTGQIPGDPARDARIAQLERQVAVLRDHPSSSAGSDTGRR